MCCPIGGEQGWIARTTMFAAVVLGMSAQASPFERAMEGHYTGGGVPVAMPGKRCREGAPCRHKAAARFSRGQRAAPFERHARSCTAGVGSPPAPRCCRWSSPKPAAQGWYSGEACALITDGAEKSEKNKEKLAPVFFEKKGPGRAFGRQAGSNRTYWSDWTDEWKFGERWGV